MEALQRGFRGELDFRIPSFSAFNRYSIQLAALSSRLNQTREIAATIAEKFIAKASDHHTLSRPRQSSPWSSSGNAGEGGLNALRSATQAQRRVHATRQKVDREFSTKKAAQAVAKAKPGRRLPRSRLKYLGHPHEPVEPAGMFLQPGAIPRRLRSQGRERSLARAGPPPRPAGRNPRIAELGMDGMVATLLGTDRIGAPGMAGSSLQAVIAPLPGGRVDRVNGSK